jgi:hypothetical protein
MRLFFCPQCRSPSAEEDLCPACNLRRMAPAETYVEKLLETVLSPEPTRVGLAVDVLTKWLHEPRALTPLLLLVGSEADAHRRVMAARGLGWLGDRSAAPALAALLQDPQQTFILRVAAAKSLGLLGGAFARETLEKALADARPSVARAAAEALEQLAALDRR